MKPLFRSPKDQQTHSRSGIAFIVEMLILLILSFSSYSGIRFCSSAR